MNGPAAKDLLVTARQLLLEKLLAALPTEQHYECRMIASAMAISTRELEHGAAAEHIEEDALVRLAISLGMVGLTSDNAGVQLKQFIRHGRFDLAGSAQESLRHELALITRARLSVSNPKVLRHAR